MKWLSFAALASCGDVKGFGSDVPPLATVNLQIAGDPSSYDPNADIHVAFVWGEQWLVEPMCILPAENADAQAVIDAGCRDPFGFVPSRVEAVVPASANGATTIDLYSLPGADVLVGDVTARVAYASLVAFDDTDHDGVLSLARPNRPPNNGMGMGMGSGSNDLPTESRDNVLGASFISMTRPDQRVAFREGAFSAVAAFYPRKGCGDPPDAFSVLAAGGFTADAAIAATLAGTLPDEDPATCSESSLATPISIGVSQPDPDLAKALPELRCTERTTDSSVRYREPEDMPDMDGRTFACVHTPSFGTPSTTVEFVITGKNTDSCVGLTHYVLRGCAADPNCTTPEWDHSTATGSGPPDWWPCPE
ncbi:MAG: hypothetical protein QM831_07845 [Kofleriaceae bacterium]